MSEANRERARHLAESIYHALCGAAEVGGYTQEKNRDLLLDGWTAEIADLLDEKDREHDPLSLAARVVELEGLLASKEWRDQILRECVKYDNEQHAGNYGMGGGTPGDGAFIVFDEIDSLLSSSSPAAEAVREVLRAAEDVLWSNPSGEPELHEALQRALGALKSDFPAFVAGLEEDR